jgi:hypothetical protein
MVNHKTIPPFVAVFCIIIRKKNHKIRLRKRKAIVKEFLARECGTLISVRDSGYKLNPCVGAVGFNPRDDESRPDVDAPRAACDKGVVARFDTFVSGGGNERKHYPLPLFRLTEKGEFFRSVSRKANCLCPIYFIF